MMHYNTVTNDCSHLLRCWIQIKKAGFPTIQYVSEVEGRENSGTCSKEVSSGTVMVIIRISLTQIFLLFPHSLLLNTFPLY